MIGRSWSRANSTTITAVTGWKLKTRILLAEAAVRAGRPAMRHAGDADATGLGHRHADHRRTAAGLGGDELARRGNGASGLGVRSEGPDGCARYDHGRLGAGKAVIGGDGMGRRHLGLLQWLR